ncbi:unnamed protein product [Effrenium voratum]|nr:unnamed protein product [Effrenium voratum]
MQKNLLLLPALTSETAFPIQRTMEDSWAPSAQQANALRELRHCAAGVARGVLRLGQVLARRRFLASFRRQRRQAWQQPKAAEIGSVMYCDMAIMSATWAKLG